MWETRKTNLKKINEEVAGPGDTAAGPSWCFVF